MGLLSKNNHSYEIKIVYHRSTNTLCATIRNNEMFLQLQSFVSSVFPGQRSLRSFSSIDRLVRQWKSAPPPPSSLNP